MAPPLNCKIKEGSKGENTLRFLELKSQTLAFAGDPFLYPWEKTTWLKVFTMSKIHS